MEKENQTFCRSKIHTLENKIEKMCVHLTTISNHLDEVKSMDSTISN